MALNAKGETLARWSGYAKESFVARADEIVKDPTSIGEKQARFAAGPTETDAATIARFFDSKGEYKDAIAHYRKAGELSGGGHSYRMEIFEATFGGFYEEMFTAEDVAAAGKEYFAAEKDPAQLITPARMVAYAARKSGNPDLAAPFIREAVEKTEGLEGDEVAAARKKILPDYALAVEKNEKKAVQYKKDAMPEGWMEKSGDLNAFAWWCFENKVNLKEAQEMAERGVELAAPGAEKARVLDTLAEICNARGDCSEAVVLIQTALREDPENEHYKKQLQKFQDLLAKGAK